MSDCTENAEIRIFLHYIYEYKKGVRKMILCTFPRRYAGYMTERLAGQGIEYLIQDVTPDKVNLFFGRGECLDVIRTFVHKPLNRLTPEEDYMLGVLLGYDLSQQCFRYCERKRAENPAAFPCPAHSVPG